MLPTQAWLTWRNNNAAQAFVFQKEKKQQSKGMYTQKKKVQHPN
jgi:hypothetical protein